MPPFEFTKKFEALVSKILTYATKETASVKNKGKREVVGHRQKLKRSGLKAQIGRKSLAMNLSAIDIKRIKRKLNLSFSANLNEQDLKKELASISTNTLRKDKWTLWRLFMQQEVKGSNGEITKKALKANHKFKKGESFHVHLWHKKAYWGIGLPHVFKKHREVYEVELTQLGKRGKNGIARRYADGKYYFVNADGSKGAYAAIYNTKIKILKIKKSSAVKKRTRAEISPPAKKEPPLENLSNKLVSRLDKAKMELTLKEHRKLFKNGKHKVRGQCEGVATTVCAKVIAKITGKYRWKSLRWSPLHAATFKYRGKMVRNLKESDFDHIPYGSVFYVAKNRPKLAKYIKGNKRKKIAPVISASGRHWFIYVGKDSQGNVILIDNHFRKNGRASLATMRRFVGNRMIVNIHNAYSAYDGRLAVDSRGKLREKSKKLT